VWPTSHVEMRVRGERESLCRGHGPWSRELLESRFLGFLYREASKTTHAGGEMQPSMQRWKPLQRLKKSRVGFLDDAFE